ncbi:MAG: hypothetical protein M3O15_11990, partial [Acidobacteriota bacterium]|nr:hypothetical protein [Acidobacteriota bacterium]
MKRHWHWLCATAAVLLVPLLVAAQVGRPQPAAAPGTRGPTVVLDGRELPVPVTISPGGPLFA